VRGPAAAARRTAHKQTGDGTIPLALTARSSPPQRSHAGGRHAFYLGKWKIIEAKVAPSTGEKVRKPDTAAFGLNDYVHILNQQP